jgi:hypothetical protein
MKKITITGKPTAKMAPTSADEWVSSDSEKPVEPTKPPEPTKRLTIDIPLSLHQRVKSQCALNGENMAEVVRQLLEDHFPPQNQPSTPGADPASK